MERKQFPHSAVVGFLEVGSDEQERPAFFLKYLQRNVLARLCILNEQVPYSGSLRRLRLDGLGVDEGPRAVGIVL